MLLMSENLKKLIEKLEDQLAQIMLYANAIESISAAYREKGHLQQDNFLFGTIYDGIWDAVIVRLWTIWDGDDKVISLPTVAKELQEIPEAKSIMEEINQKANSERCLIEKWRHNVIAHRNKKILIEISQKFDIENRIDINAINKEIDRIESLLAKIRNCFNQPTTYYQVLKEEAKNDAHKFILLWGKSTSINY